MTWASRLASRLLSSSNAKGFQPWQPQVASITFLCWNVGNALTVDDFGQIQKQYEHVEHVDNHSACCEPTTFVEKFAIARHSYSSRRHSAVAPCFQACSAEVLLGQKQKNCIVHLQDAMHSWNNRLQQAESTSLRLTRLAWPPSFAPVCLARLQANV